ncbi:hypothetical protein ARMSODRAFT_983577 [Armillaria solidipes]|uniref:Uncharacterized protein n=1 Tax=Armillaria solidipes TaxID=1076256 RepID=A0A2H3AYA2_9AGAR|nr:hypothetical protein ARMSODRAFT_983577 [Armillaria solidipes]
MISYRFAFHLGLSYDRLSFQGLWYHYGSRLRGSSRTYLPGLSDCFILAFQLRSLRVRCVDNQRGALVAYMRDCRLQADGGNTIASFPVGARTSSPFAFDYRFVARHSRESGTTSVWTTFFLQRLYAYTQARSFDAWYYSRRLQNRKCEKGSNGFERRWRQALQRKLS